MPEGVFSGLTALQDLRLQNNRLRALPADVFSGLGALDVLYLQGNELTALPEGVFNELRSLDSLQLEDNPGSAGFRPIADAGADQVAEAGRAFTLRATASDADPWGDNVAHVWTQTDNGGAMAELTGAGTAMPSLVAPLSATELEFELRTTGLGGDQYMGTDTVVVFGVATTSVAVVSDPIQGDAYRLGEVIELALTFDRVVTVDTTGGRPSIELDVGGVRRRAHYVRGGGSWQLVFAYAVQSTDSDGDGIRICGAGQLPDCTGAISPNGGALEYHPGLGALLRHPSQPDQEGHRVDGSLTGLSDGVCNRTKAVRSVLVRRLGAADCSEVTVAQLEGLTGTLSLQRSNIETLRPWDFSDLIALQNLRLDNNILTSLPAGIFSGLRSLQTLRLLRNRLTTLPSGVFAGLTALQILNLQSNRLTTLPEGVFSGLTALQNLRLQSNRLRALPADVFSGLGALQFLNLPSNELTTLPEGVFSDLTALRDLRLQNNRLRALPADVFSGLGVLYLLYLQGNELTALPGGVFNELRSLDNLRMGDNPGSVGFDNPGSAGFRPIADAGADQASEAGRVVTLRAVISDADSWGDNVAHAWTQTDNSGAMAELTGADTATPGFVMPAGATELEFELRTTGRGGNQYFSTDTVVVVRVATLSVAVTSAPVQGDVYLLDGVIELALTSDRPVMVDTAGGRPSIFLDVGGVRRRAYYTRGSGTKRLVFAYTVQPTDRDEDGIGICGAGQLPGCMGAISPNGGTLEYRPGLRALLRHPSRLVRSPRVDGGGVCNRTPAVRDALVDRLGAAGCSRVTAAQLGGLTGTLSLQNSSIGTLKPDDLAGLTALQELHLQNNALAMLPEGVFSDLAALETLQLDNNRLTTLSVSIFSGLAALETLQLDNNSLTTLSAGIFSGLAALETLQLDNNSLTTLSVGIFSGLAALETLQLDNNSLSALPEEVFSGLGALQVLGLPGNGLTTLPAGVFNDLRALRTLDLSGNPGFANFAPLADAGADQAAEAGQVVALRAAANAVDPWGDNVALAWTQSDDSGVMAELTGAGTATPGFVMPAGAAELEFELRVSGRGAGSSGERYIGTDRVVVRLIPDTVVTLSGPGTMVTTGIDEDVLRLVYSYSATTCGVAF